MKLFEVYPLHDIEIVKGQGSLIWDKKGQEYLDMYGGHAVISIGHTHMHYVQRLTSQLNKIGFYSNSVKIPQQVQLAEKLGVISGRNNYQLFLCNSGAEANENAFKLASFANNRKIIVSFTKAFHGRTSLAVAATDNPKIIAPVNQTNNVVFLPFGDAIALENYFAENGSKVSAVIVEGIQGVGGIQVAGNIFLQTIRTMCDAYGAYFIADSVQCGYGRTGKFYAHDYAQINADIYTMAKGMGNGFPVAGIAIHPKLSPWYGMLGTTFGGNHLACAAALAVLEEIETHNLIKNAAIIGDYLITELKKIPQIIEVRGRGLMIGIDLPTELAHIKADLLFKEHIFTGEAKPNVIRLLPALNLTKAHADRFLTSFSKLINQA
ncbi:MAG: aspartate aminotransferase family protein [Sphingobacteriales bacterium]|nr:MAG: aspartate aminotransferase family protein [Sphingobacteriales bacterium]